MAYEDCAPSEKVSVLHIHGTEDESVDIDGTGSYPSAQASLDGWASLNGCEVEWQEEGTIDLDEDVVGDETTVLRNAGCEGVNLEYWRIEGGDHIPAFGDSFPTTMWEWMSRSGR